MWRALWLPILIGLGFLLVFAAVLGPRLAPATPVEIMPALAVALDAPAESAPTAPNTQPPTQPAASPGEPLFQAAGWVEPDPLPIHAPALIPGIIREIFVIEGDRVEAGQPIAALIDDDARLDLAEAEAAHRQAGSEVAAARSAATAAEAMVALRQQQVSIATPQLEAARDRQQRLEGAGTGAIAEGEVIQARFETFRREAELESAKAEVPVAEAEKDRAVAGLELAEARLQSAAVTLDRARLNFDRTRINAPVDGVILRLLRAPGTKVMMDGDHSDSATVAILYQPQHLQVRVDVPLNQVARVFLGQAATIRCDLLPDQVLSGRVTSIGGEADLQRNSLQVKVRIDQPDPRLRPDMLSRVSFMNRPAEDSSDPPDPSTTATPSSPTTGGFAILIPPSALPGDWAPGTETHVWVMDPDQRAERRTVTPGPIDDAGEVRILDGLRAGEPVILNPPSDLRERRRLAVARANP